MGHYRCGGVAAAIASPPPPSISASDTVVQKWIAPIHEIYQASNQYVISNFLGWLTEYGWPYCRSEIAELRNKNKDFKTVKPPELHECQSIFLHFQIQHLIILTQLIEENIKSKCTPCFNNCHLQSTFPLIHSLFANIHLICMFSTIPSHHCSIFIHGWVYDIKNGEVKDLGVSVGPAGKEIPYVPFTAVHNMTEAHWCTHHYTTL